MLAYCIAMVYLGYFIPTCITIFCLCTMFSEGMGLKLWKRILFSLVLTSAIYFIFTSLLVMKLPTGKFF